MDDGWGSLLVLAILVILIMIQVARGKKPDD